MSQRGERHPSDEFRSATLHSPIFVTERSYERCFTAGRECKYSAFSPGGVIPRDLLSDHSVAKKFLYRPIDRGARNTCPIRDLAALDLDICLVTMPRLFRQQAQNDEIR